MVDNYGNGIMNPRAYQISGKITHKLKRLDGGLSFTVELKHYNGGKPTFTVVEVEVNYAGKVTGDSYDKND